MAAASVTLHDDIEAPLALLRLEQESDPLIDKASARPLGTDMSG
jgi:hypothetical protein